MSVATAPNYPQLADQGVIMTAYSKLVNVKYYAECMLPEITHSRWQGNIKDQGDKVIIAQRATITTKPYKKGQTLAVEVPSAPPIELSVNRARYYNFIIDDIDAKQTHLVLNDEYVDDGTKNMAIDVEGEFLADVYADAHVKNQGDKAGAKSGRFNLGKAGTPLVVTKSNIVENLLTAGRAVLGEQNAANGKKLFVVIPEVFRWMLMNSDLKNASVTGDDKNVQRLGRLGELDGMVVYSSNLLPYNENDDAFHIIGGNTEAIASVAQMTKSETMRSQNTFGQLYRGLHVYDWLVNKPEGIFHAYARAA